jgi:transcriptional regulator with XRE-family HTH domain
MHGTPTGYEVCGCRCEACLKACRRQRKTRHLRPMRPSAPVREHIDLLTASGLTVHEIAERAGLSWQTVQWVRTHQTISPRIARALLAVSGVTPFGCRRRIAALQVIGWTMSQIEAEAGVARGCASQIMAGRHRPTPAKMDAFARAYEVMWRGPEKPSVASMSRARQKGWVPPLAWDDDTIDDPRVSPAGMVDERSIEDLVSDLLELASFGESWAEAARRVGYSRVDGLERRLFRYHRFAEVRAAFRREGAAA